MRIASYNVENLFDRAKALHDPDLTVGAAVLQAHALLNTVLSRASYGPGDRRRILALLAELDLLQSDEAQFARLRQNRGQLLRRPRTGSPEVVADGRGDWIGWVELTTARVDAVAMTNTARVLADVGADVVGLVEAESRIALKRFADAGLVVGRKSRYAHVMVVDGNDDRGIDVGVVSTARWPLGVQRSHVDDTDQLGRIFSRDCAEYHFRSAAGSELVLLVNHFKSKGYGKKADSDRLRLRQATRVADIYRQLRDQQNAAHVAVLGDLNDTPDSAPLAPLLTGTDLRDVSTHPGFDDGGRPGTYANSTAGSKIDYVLLSPALWDRTTGGANFRMGVWGGKNGTLWPVYDTMKKAVQAASDHAAVYADINLA